MIATTGDESVPRRPARIGRVFLAGLLLGSDTFLLVIWALWFAAFLQGSEGLMAINDVVVPVGYALALGPLAIASLVAVGLISLLRAYPVILGIAGLWLALALFGYGSGGLPVTMLLITRLAIFGLLVSGRRAFHR